MLNVNLCLVEVSDVHITLNAICTDHVYGSSLWKHGYMYSVCKTILWLYIIHVGYLPDPISLEVTPHIRNNKASDEFVWKLYLNNVQIVNIAHVIIVCSGQWFNDIIL